MIGWQDVGTNFTWIAILDNNWALPKSNPEKNLRSLILAGYDRIYYADEMVDKNLNLNPYNRFISDLHERFQKFPKSANYVSPPDNLEISTEHDEAEHGEPGAFFFDY